MSEYRITAVVNNDAETELHSKDSFTETLTKLAAHIQEKDESIPVGYTIMITKTKE